MDRHSDLLNYIELGATTLKRLGVEVEHFVCDNDMKLISFSQLESLIRDIAAETDGKLVLENGNAVAIRYDNYTITLEPAGQVEISVSPFEAIEEIEKIYDDFRSIWDKKLAAVGYHFDCHGVFMPIENGMYDYDEIPLIPKKRYEIMDRHFEKSGHLGKYMMRCTASTQVSVDYSSPDDAVRKIRLLERLSPLFALIMENRNGEGTAKRWQHPHLIRTQIWNDVDASRCGYIPHAMQAGYSLSDYADAVLNAPLVVNDNGVTITPADKTALDLSDEDFDVSHTLSMFFFHIRLRQYIEIRVADSVNKERMLAYAALIKGLVYNEKTLIKLEEQFAQIKTEADIINAENAIMNDGYNAVVYGKNVTELLADLYYTARNNLDDKEREYLKSVLTLPVYEYIYSHSVKDNISLHSQSAKEVKDVILNSTAKYHNRVVKSQYFPKMFTENEVERFAQAVRVLYGIVGKIVSEYIDNMEYRKLFGFDKRIEELILRDVKYSALIPISRVDLFYNEQTGNYKFCEFNTDGASAMNEDRELNNSLKHSLAYKEFSKEFTIKSFELFDSWVEAFLSDYHEFAENLGRDAVPNVAIVDFMDKATANEFEIFKNAFIARGVYCEVCDIRSLSFDKKHCFTPSGMRVDAVYRRAVTSDIIDNYSEITDFIMALKADAFCLIGDIRTEIMHNKKLFEMMFRPETQRLLTAGENEYISAHVPYTALLTSDVLSNDELKSEILKNKDNWIIKPEDSYGSKGVHAGVECNEKEWQGFVKECTDSHYILQQFCMPYALDNIDLDFNADRGLLKPTSNLTGIFVYNGELKGLYSRVSYDKVISTQYNEMTLPTIIVK